MKKNSSSKSGFINLRNLVAVLLCTAGIPLAILSFGATPTTKNVTVNKATAVKAKAADPAAAPAAPSPGSGTLSVSNPSVSFTDPVGPVPNATGEGVTSGGPTCAMNGVDCSNYVLTLDPSIFSAATGYNPANAYVVIQLSWSPTAYQYGSFVEDKNGNVIASNTTGADPETISIPVTTTPNLQANGPYTIVTTLEIGTPGTGYTATVSLKQLTSTVTQCNGCIPPRYQMYAGPDNQSGEPSIGVDWNPNVAAYQQVAAGNASHGPTALDTGGVAFFTANLNQYRVAFDDCSSPAINTWTATTFPTEGVTTLDPIGLTDHFANVPLGTSYPPPKTPGRTWQTQLSGVSSISAFTDNDGQSYTPTEGGGPPTGPDHETDGAGPYNPNSTPPPPPPTVYANAFYYCSQNIVGDAECSRSDDGGVTFGPGVPIFQNLTQCTGGIHGHVKVASDGTVYVPNFSCSLPGAAQGVAMSTDNGLTWKENNVPGSGLDGSASVDPSVAVAQNAVGRPSGQTTPTIYFGYMDTDNTPKIAVSHDRGATWSTPQAVGASLGVVNSTFPAVVAGDDNRAAFGFLGSTTSGDANSDNALCSTWAGVWHLYIATTYDGGNSWVTIDATPNSPVQVGPICRGGTLCPGYRNLLDFNGFDVDSQGRGYFAISDGCINCTNSGPGAPCGSSNALSVIFRQSGGPRLFSMFDPPAVAAPASPQALSAIEQTGGVQVSWLQPDNGGSPILSYNIYRGTTSGGETFLASVSNSPTNTQTKYFDTTATGSSNYFYHVTAVSAGGESGFCEELSATSVQSGGTTCTAPYVEIDGAGTGTTDPSMGTMTIESVNAGEPFTSCADQSLTLTMQTQTMDPTGTGKAVPFPNGEWRIRFHITDDSGNPEVVFVSMDTQGPGTTSANPEFVWGREDPSATGGTFDSAVCTASTVSTCPTIVGSVTPQGLITIKLSDTALSFPAPTGATGNAFTWTPKKGAVLASMDGTTLLLVGGGGTGLLETIQSDGPVGSGSYTMQGNLSCAAAPPTAVLSANPLSGNAPLAVSFDGSGSTVAPILAACDSIASYTLNFGDGSPPVTQSTSKFSHTYRTPGSYPAVMTVTDTIGQTSNNLAQQVITVKSTGSPQLNRVGSRMTHGTAGTFDINLIGTRGVECRTSATLGAGNYTLVFTFQNKLVGVEQAVVTNGTATVSSSAIGPNPTQYTVQLTGVANAQYLQVTLLNANDGHKIGNVSATMGVLIGNVGGAGTVTGGDVAAVQRQVGHSVTSSNFRDDVNADGAVSNADVTITKAHVGTKLH